MVNSRRFKITDTLLIVMMILPLLTAIVIKILTNPESEGIAISGALVYFTIPMPKWDLPITEAQVNSWLIMISILGLCLYLTHGLSPKAETKRQHLAEYIVTKTEALVHENMGEFFSGFAPFIGAILALSAFSSLSSLLGIFPPTSDLNVIAGWAILVFLLITYYKLKCGLGYYIKSFTEPIALLTPFNIIGEIATPVSMTFRHYGNIVSGSVISALIAAGLRILSSWIFGWLPGAIGEFPFLRIGLPAILSAYFDVFSGCLQAFIFSILTMINISGAFDFNIYTARKNKKFSKKQKVN